MSGQGKNRFLRGYCVLHHSIFHLSFILYLMYWPQFFAFTHPGQSIWMSSLTSKLHLLKPFMLKCYFTENMLIIPANSNLQNSHSSLYCLITKTLYILLVIYVCLSSLTNCLFRDNRTIVLLIIFSHSTEKSMFCVSFLLSIHSFNDYMSDYYFSKFGFNRMKNQ